MMSWVRSWARRCAASSRNTRSPLRWPCSSLMRLNQSTSNNNRPKGWPLRWAWASCWCRVCWIWRRLCRPVSSSVKARVSLRASALSFTITTMPKLASTLNTMTLINTIDCRGWFSTTDCSVSIPVALATARTSRATVIKASAASTNHLPRPGVLCQRCHITHASCRLCSDSTSADSSTRALVCSSKALKASPTRATGHQIQRRGGWRR